LTALFLFVLQVAQQQPRFFISHGYSTAIAVGLREAAQRAGQLALPCPDAEKASLLLHVSKMSYLLSRLFYKSCEVTQKNGAKGSAPFF
jgi:hypothetical protein